MIKDKVEGALLFICNNFFFNCRIVKRIFKMNFLVLHVALLYYLVSLSYTSPAGAPVASTTNNKANNDKELVELLRQEKLSPEYESSLDTDLNGISDEDIETLFPTIYQRFLNEQNLINEYLRREEEELGNEKDMFSDSALENPQNDDVSENEQVKDKDGFKVLEKDKVIKSKDGHKISKIHTEEGSNKEGNAQFKKISFEQNQVYSSTDDKSKAKQHNKNVVAPPKVPSSTKQV